MAQGRAAHAPAPTAPGGVRSTLAKATRRCLCLLALLVPSVAPAQTWTADNGNGTYSNPLFYDEFSDPDLIRVGSDFYLTGTTMHAMPGLPVLHSRDLVNWTLLGYALDRLDLGPEYRLEGGGQIYGRGIWAPSFRYHAGTFHIFSNVNGRTTQLFRAADPHGPWTRTAMRRSFHDLSVLFDDDGKVYVVWGHRDIHFAQLDTDLTDIVPGTERVIIPADAGMGEGSHFYKIRGRYYIVSAWYERRMRMPCARADRPEGPYEVNPEISADEDFGLAQGYRLRSAAGPPFDIAAPDPSARGHLSMHQGGIVDTPTGEWWGFSMMDYNSVGRLTMLSPVTWQDGWPFFGLPGNLGRTPRTWVKPQTGVTSPPSAPYQRNDDFAGPTRANVWQWNHVPDDTRWSLTERRGFLRLHSLSAPDFWSARNTLTQRAIGPRSVPTVVLETGGMRPGDVAGLGLLNFPYAWIGVRRGSGGFTVEQFDQTTGMTVRRPLRAGRVWLRADCDFLSEKARFSYSTDGRRFESLGGEFTMVFQLTTFQGVRYSLFHYNDGGAPGGYADFDAMTERESDPRGLMTPIPVGRAITLAAVADGAALVADADSLRGVRTSGGRASRAASRFLVVDRGLGRVALRTATGFVRVDTAGGASRVVVQAGEPSDAETFQWIETPYGDLVLLSLVTHRYLRVDPGSSAVAADSPGPVPDRADGITFRWTAVRRAADPELRR
jgi:beta-xylosidase